MGAGIESPYEAFAPEYRAKLARGVARMIARYTWHWFSTHTFIVDVKPAYALRCYEVWIARLNEASNSRSRARVAPGSAAKAAKRRKVPGDSSASYVCALEWTDNGRAHLHSAVRFADETSWQALSRVRWCDKWERLGHRCGMARIYLQRGRASSYLAKELGKGAVFILGGPFVRGLGRRTPDSLVRTAEALRSQELPGRGA